MLRMVSNGLLLFEMIYLELYSLFSCPAYVRLAPSQISEVLFRKYFDSFLQCFITTAVCL